MSQTGKIFSAMLAGVILGGLLGIRAFSRSRVLRQKIVKKTEALADRLSEKIEEGKTLLTDLQKRTEAASNTVKRAMASK